MGAGAHPISSTTAVRCSRRRKAEAIFWGSNWNNASFAGDKMDGLATFFNGFGGSNFAGTNTEYSGITQLDDVLGRVIDATTQPPRKALTVSQAVAEACKITGNNPDPNGVYFIYTSTTAGHVNYCAWHSWGNCSNGAPVQVAYMPNIDGIAGLRSGRRDSTATRRASPRWRTSRRTSCPRRSPIRVRRLVRSGRPGERGQVRVGLPERRDAVQRHDLAAAGQLVERALQRGDRLCQPERAEGLHQR